MKSKYSCLACICAVALCASVVAQTNETTQTVVAVEATQPIELEDTTSSKWSFDVSLYLLAPGMTGDATIKGRAADMDVGFDKIWDNLHMTGMGSVRIGYGKWSLNTDVIYMDLEADADTMLGPVEIGFEQWMVEPSLSYRFSPKFEVLAGARYSNLSGELSGPGPVQPSGTQDWWDPIVGGEINLPFAEKFSANLRGDIGGFGVGSDLSWQAFPYLGWQFTDWGGIQLGYRWLYMDYEDSEKGFSYSVMTQGPQLGLTASF